MRKSRSQAISWLPVDSRLFPFFTFSHVHGVARFFLIIEITLSVAIVLGAIMLAALSVFS